MKSVVKFLNGLVLAWLIFVLTLVGCAHAPSAPLSFSQTAEVTKQADNSSRVFLAQYELLVAMHQRYPVVDVDLRFVPCGELNGYYYPDEKTIYLCTEFAAYPNVALFVAAHEMGHAIAFQLLHVADEESADEIAAIEMLRLGLGTDLMEAALFFKSKSTPGEGAPRSGHPAYGFRAWNLACMASGRDGHPAACVELYRATKLRWETRLAKWLAVEKIK